MSQALWCDPGKHPFSALDVDAQQMTITKQTRNQWGGQQPYTVTQDVCGPCMRKAGLLEDSPKELGGQGNGDTEK